MSNQFLGLNFIIRGLFVFKSVNEFRVNFMSSVITLKFKVRNKTCLAKTNLRSLFEFSKRAKKLTLGQIFELF